MNWDDLSNLIGPTTRSLGPQRVSLKALATPGNQASLFLWNHQHIQSTAPQPSSTDFYLDPHTQHYTGDQAVLKGWCAAIRWADKLINSDYIHTATGQPIYFECGDNYEDLRSRFIPLANRFHTTLQWSPGQTLTYIIDRGIYGLEGFKRILDEPTIHFITWEKGCPPLPWDAAAATGSSAISKHRNDANDLRHYHFSWRSEPWPTNDKILRIIVQAKNPNDKSIQVTILSSDPTRPIAEIVHLMFNRWIQENDFKYLDKHFGINQLTSYRSTPYSELRRGLTDRLVPNHLWQEKTKERKNLYKKHHRLLVAADEAHRTETTRQDRIQEIKTQLGAQATQASRESRESRSDAGTNDAKKLLTKELGKQEEASKRADRYRQVRQTNLDASHRQLEENQRERSELEQNVSRLDQLEAAEKVKIDTAAKSLMDGLRLIARNQFYAALQPFKAAYDNYRDDHDYFRDLTQSSGLLRWTGETMEVHLTPRVNYQPKLRKIIQEILAGYTKQEMKMPDGSGRKLSFHLAEWSQFRITGRT